VEFGRAGLGRCCAARHKPKLAADLSAGIWDLDFYGEVALRFGQDIDRVRYDSSAYANLPDVPYNSLDSTPWLVQALEHRVDALYPLAPSSGVKPQATGGVSYSIKYAANDVFTISAEYFYNGLGYNDTAVYPGLVLPTRKPSANRRRSSTWDATTPAFSLPRRHPIPGTTPPSPCRTWQSVRPFRHHSF